MSLENEIKDLSMMRGILNRALSEVINNQYDTARMDIETVDDMLKTLIAFKEVKLREQG